MILKFRFHLCLSNHSQLDFLYFPLGFPLYLIILFFSPIEYPNIANLKVTKNADYKLTKIGKFKMIFKVTFSDITLLEGYQMINNRLIGELRTMKDLSIKPNFSAGILNLKSQ